MEDRGQKRTDRTDDDVATDDVAEELLVEEVSIDGMCGVY